MSSKNILQEYCQKNHIDLPVYTTTEIGNQRFESKLVWDECTYISHGNSKKEAEKKVAKIVFDSIQTQIKKCKQTITDSIFFVDIENKPEFLRELKTQYHIETGLYGFAKKDHPSVIKNQNLGVCVCTSSGYRDAADILMIGTVFTLVETIPKNYWIYLVSSDHFVYGLRDILLEKGFTKVLILASVSNIQK